MIELYMFGGIYAFAFLLAGFMYVASKYAEKHPHTKFSKWWYEN